MLDFVSSNLKIFDLKFIHQICQGEFAAREKIGGRHFSGLKVGSRKYNVVVVN